MSAIECTSAGVKDLADGSLRITLEFEPRNAKEAFSLFGARGTSCAIVALTKEAAKQSAQDKIIEADKPKGGELAKLAGIFCKDPKFWEWLDIVGDWVNSDEKTARDFILAKCHIESRAELDSKFGADQYFHINIREPYSKWLRDNG